MRKIYVLYHANCNDGFGAAFAAWLRLGRDANTNYIAINYGEPPPAMEDKSDVYILDFSYPRAVLLELASNHNQLVVLDHHKTAQEDLKDLPFAHFNMEKSGAVLAWEYFHTDRIPQILRYVDDRDLWRFSLPDSRQINAAIYSYPHDFGVWEDLRSVPLVALEREGSTCLRLQAKYVVEMLKNKRTAVISPQTKFITFVDIAPKSSFGEYSGIWYCPCVNATILFSEVAEALLKDFPEAKFSAYYWDGNGKRNWGLRSRNDFDCSIIAKAFGGGGHAQAAGFSQDLL